MSDYVYRDLSYKSDSVKCRRFRPVGATGKIRNNQLAEDQHGSFMLVTDHIDIVQSKLDMVAQVQRDKNDTIEALEETVGRLKEKVEALQRVIDIGRGAPTDYVVLFKGQPFLCYPTEEMCQAAVNLLVYDNRGHHKPTDYEVQPRWK